jgi:hypothetical protein
MKKKWYPWMIAFVALLASIGISVFFVISIHNHYYQSPDEVQLTNTVPLSPWGGWAYKAPVKAPDGPEVPTLDAADWLNKVGAYLQGSLGVAATLTSSLATVFLAAAALAIAIQAQSISEAEKRREDESYARDLKKELSEYVKSIKDGFEPGKLDIHLKSRPKTIELAAVNILGGLLQNMARSKAAQVLSDDDMKVYLQSNNDERQLSKSPENISVGFRNFGARIISRHFEKQENPPEDRDTKEIDNSPHHLPAPYFPIELCRKNSSSQTTKVLDINFTKGNISNLSNEVFELAAKWESIYNHSYTHVADILSEKKSAGEIGEYTQPLQMSIDEIRSQILFAADQIGISKDEDRIFNCFSESLALTCKIYENHSSESAANGRELFLFVFVAVLNKSHGRATLSDYFKNLRRAIAPTLCDGVEIAKILELKDKSAKSDCIPLSFRYYNVSKYFKDLDGFLEAAIRVWDSYEEEGFEKWMADEAKSIKPQNVCQVLFSLNTRGVDSTYFSFNQFLADTFKSFDSDLEDFSSILNQCKKEIYAFENEINKRFNEVPEEELDALNEEYGQLWKTQSALWDTTRKLQLKLNDDATYRWFESLYLRHSPERITDCV